MKCFDGDKIMAIKPRTTLVATLLALGACLVIPSSDAAIAQNGAKLYQTGIDFREVAKNAIPAVVSIKVKGSGRADTFNLGGDPSDDSQESNEDLWSRFFGLPRQKQADQQQFIGQASGFIISPSGHILTNSHVVKDMSEISVLLNDGREFPAKVIGLDTNTDIALIKIDAADLPYLKLGNSDNLEVGQWVVAIGNPLGLQASLTAGIVSAKGRNNLDLTRIEDYIQTDAAINKGNSGGPLLNLDSEVIGMNSAIVTNMGSGGYMGIGFAIPSNLLKTVMDDLQSTGKFHRGFMGVALQQIDNELALAFNLDKAEGTLIAEVTKDSPAEKAGIKQGDIILKLNGLPVHNISTLRNTISIMKPGSKATLLLLRNGKMINTAVEIGTFPTPGAIASSLKDSKLGIEVETLTPDTANRLGYPNASGVVISKIDARSPVAWAGLKKGALIIEVNKKKIGSVEDFNTAVKETEAGRPILMLIKQGDATRFVSIKMG